MFEARTTSTQIKFILSSLATGALLRHVTVAPYCCDKTLLAQAFKNVDSSLYRHESTSFGFPMNWLVFFKMWIPLYIAMNPHFFSPGFYKVCIQSFWISYDVAIFLKNVDILKKTTICLGQNNVETSTNLKSME